MTKFLFRFILHNTLKKVYLINLGIQELCNSKKDVKATLSNQLSLK